MIEYKQKKFTGERALFQSEQIKLNYCTFGFGESPLKESHNLDILHTGFQWKYPLWYCQDVSVNDCVFSKEARAGIWYTNKLVMTNSTIEAPKTFRRCNNLRIDYVDLPDAQETLWNCQNVNISHCIAQGDYFGMGCTDVTIEDFTLHGNYSFDGSKNITIRNAKMMSKDAFWNCENVTIYDSYISGQYFGWNSKNITLINCTIESEQGMCYMDNIRMENCRLLNTNLAFEYSSVQANIIGTIDSVKNPKSGQIKAQRINEIIQDDPKQNHKLVNIFTEVG